MWGRKDEPMPASAPEPRAPVQSTPPSAPRPAAPPEPVAARPSSSGASAQAQIGKSLKLKGEVTGAEDLYIDGEVEGTVELRDNSLTVGPNGNVRAHVRARAITILGRLEGNVQAGERIEIRKTGSLEGDLVTPRILIEDGAVFRGSIDILKGAESDSSASKSSATAPAKDGAAVAAKPAAAASPRA